MKYLAILLAILTGCTGYQASHDCPIPDGVKCTSVTDLEQMIAETEEGPDIFLGTPKYENPQMSSQKKYIYVPSKHSKKYSGHYYEVDGSF